MIIKSTEIRCWLCTAFALLTVTELTTLHRCMDCICHCALLTVIKYINCMDCICHCALLTVIKYINPTLLHGLHLSLCSATVIKYTLLQGVVKKDMAAAM